VSGRIEVSGVSVQVSVFGVKDHGSRCSFLVSFLLTPDTRHLKSQLYMPPLLIAAILGTIAAVATARLLNRYRLSRYFFYPPLVFVALAVIFTVLLGAVLIPF
jgi:hypothetical protein